MQLEKNGKEIKEVKINKKTVTIQIENVKIELDKIVYENNYLYIGKILQDKDILRLKKENQNAKNYAYALRLLSRKRYSEFELRNKLSLHKVNSSQIEEIINKLKSINLINDDRLSREIIEEENEKCYGKLHIVMKLESKYLDISKVKEIPIEEEIRKAKRIIERFIVSKTGDLRNETEFHEEILKQKLFALLMAKGYELNDIETAWEEYKHENDFRIY